MGTKGRLERKKRKGVTTALRHVVRRRLCLWMTLFYDGEKPYTSEPPRGKEGGCHCAHYSGSDTFSLSKRSGFTGTKGRNTTKGGTDAYYVSINARLIKLNIPQQGSRSILRIIKRTAPSRVTGRPKKAETPQTGRELTKRVVGLTVSQAKTASHTRYSSRPHPDTPHSPPSCRLPGTRPHMA
jgi:hypothetical protein